MFRCIEKLTVTLLVGWGGHSLGAGYVLNCSNTKK